MKVVIVGSGNVAEALAVGLHEANVEVAQIFARNEVRGEAVAAMAGATWSATQLAVADIYLLAVSDRAVADVAASLELPEGAIVAHTAGCCPIEALPTGTRRGVFYPFQTFSAGRRVDFSKIHIFVEAEDDTTKEALEALARRLTTHVAEADSARRATIHLSGVFVNNFANCMFADAAAILAEVGLGFDVLAPIALETATKAGEANHPAEVQTGPARRGDIPTLDRHRAMLASKPELLDLYNKISENIWHNSEISKR